ncbi:hypothetical protein L6164_003223 [Bauhinia variegata]|uniref:Uncharacterized protein n=1 Tax=Bauhinia variegata TaxID=167791 RepID=A0ACB9Q0M2_BAUVA|nr:hypothetical protein L6164_003223 [Bauhinia variegata]
MPNYYEEEEAYERYRFGGEINPPLLELKHLNHLDLSCNDFGGMPIPNFIGSLKSLTYLNLSAARFRGEIPHQLGNLSNLLFLDLGTSQFSGKIPCEIGNLTSLIHLDIGSYYSYRDELSLSVENLHWLSSLSFLEYLDLSFINLSQASDWLWVAHKLSALKELHLSGCPLHYHNQPSIVNFSSLVILDLYQTNYFHASFISDWIFGLSKLISLRIGYNYFQGPIPDGIQNLTLLENLFLIGNSFNSSIPNWLYSLGHLKFLSLSGNNLHGTLSEDIANLTSIVSLDLSSNQLEEKVPTSLGFLCNLRQLHLSFKKCTQNISEILKIFSAGCVSLQLEILEISNSQLSGHLTDEIGVFRNLVGLSLYNNSIQGVLPKSLEKLSSLEFFDVGTNKLEGNPFEIVGKLFSMQDLSLGYNKFQGFVTEAHLANLTSLVTLYAPESQFTLKVNSNWSPPFQLVWLGLSSWQLGPDFPLWIKSQKYLRYLLISNTGITDLIPNWFWSAYSNGLYADLSNNQIYGELSVSSENPISFFGVNLSSNHLSGQLPFLSSSVSKVGKQLIYRRYSHILEFLIIIWE